MRTMVHASLSPRLRLQMAFGLCACLVLAQGLRAQTAAAPLHLPQVRATIQLNEETATAAREHFAQPSADNPIPDSLQLLLLRSLPGNFLSACTAMVKSWGTEAAGTETWHVGLLSRQGQRAWLFIRCSSSADDMADYSDEGLGLLHVDSGKLELVPLGGNAANDSTLYHVSFAEKLSLGPLEGEAFRVTARGNNPCCAGTDTHSAERLVVFVDSPQGVEEALSIVTDQTDTNHSDDPEEDSETFYKADVQFEHDAGGQVTGLTAKFQKTKNRITYQNGPAERKRVSEDTGTLRYRWNAKSLKFEETK